MMGRAGQRLTTTGSPTHFRSSAREEAASRCAAWAFLSFICPWARLPRQARARGGEMVKKGACAREPHCNLRASEPRFGLCVRLTSCSLVSRPVYGSGLGSAPSPRLLLLRAHCETTRGPGTSWPVLEHGVRCEPPHALIGKMELSSAHPDLPTLASLEYSVDTQRHKKNSSGHFIQHNEICIIIYFHTIFEYSIHLSFAKLIV